MATTKRKPTAAAAPIRADGQIRQSQMITTYGPGAMVDLVDRAVVIGGLEHWGFDPSKIESVDDARLRRSLVPRLKALDPSLDLAQEHYFRLAPACDARDPTQKVGVRALEFPRWFVCQGCRRLARAADAFETKNNRYRHACERGKWAHAVPVRFVAACDHGHLTDFPWIFFAHDEDKVCDRPELYLHEGATGDVARITVRCDNCGAPPRPLSAAAVLPFPCPGDRPWLGGRAASEHCSKQLKLMVRTASHAYFAQVVSALRLPEPDPDPLALKLREKDIWDLVQRVTSLEQLRMLVPLFPRLESVLQGVGLARALAVIEAERSAEQHQVERPLRSAEYERLTHAPEELQGSLAPQGVKFAAFEVPAARADLPTGVSRLVVVPELREVRVQVSFSRFSALSADLQGEYDLSGQKVRPAVLTLPTGNEKWLPAAEVRGEGIFFELDPEQVHLWEERDEVQARAETLRLAFIADRQGGEFPGVRFYLLHSLAHLLLTAISLECGYAASAIRERIYCDPIPGPKSMAGILLTTGTTGSEGTLGGLVEEGRRLRHHLREAWDLGRLCSNDPVCATHDPAAEADDRRLEGAACHGCLYIAEPSCERFNRFLDRALVVPTIGNDPRLAYFAERP